MSDIPWYAGLGLVEDAIEISAGIQDHSWVDATLGGVGCGLDALGMVLDPLGSLMAWGVGWLLEHVEPLREALDQLAGDPGAVGAQAASWQTASASVENAHQRYSTAVSVDTAGRAGAAGEAYRSHAAEQSALVQGLERI